MTMNQYIVYLVIRINVEMPNASRDTPPPDRILYFAVSCDSLLFALEILHEFSTRIQFIIEEFSGITCLLVLLSSTLSAER